MGFDYRAVDRVATISPADFYNHYVKPQKPVVVEQLTADWPAYEKWHFEYIKQVAGDTVVPLYNNDPVDYTKKVNEPDATMSMRDYIDLLLNGQTTLRIFLYSLMKHAPVLQSDFKFPDLKLKLIKSLPFLFFGGKGVNVFMHYDIDLSNILHFHFAGEKRCIIIPPEQTPLMYKIPYSNICHESINIDDPDFDQWPALRHVCGLFRSMLAIWHEGFLTCLLFVSMTIGCASVKGLLGLKRKTSVPLRKPMPI